MNVWKLSGRSVAWAIALIVLSTVFVSWRIWLIGSVDGLREDLRRRVTLARQLTAVTDAFYAMEVTSDPTKPDLDAWQRHLETCRSTLAQMEPAAAAIDGLSLRVQRVDAEMREMVRLDRLARDRESPGSGARAITDLRDAGRRAYAESKGGLDDVRAGLSRIAAELDDRWKHVNVLGIVASVMAVAMAGMVYALQGALTRSRAAEERERLLEEERNRAARLAAMGEMAAGLAHQINQPLTSIHSYIAGCQRRLREAGGNHADILEAMAEAKSEAHRASSIVERIRTFVSGQGLRPAPLPLNELVHDARMLVAGDLRSRGIRLSLDVADNLPLVRVDRIHMEQVLVNLIRNAIEAMRSRPPDQRVLTIRTSRADGDEVEVAISDTGGGLTQDEWKHLFEPFHTSKPGGLGLGLAISRRIVEAHDGRIWVEPNRDRGITVRFRLPCSREGVRV